MGARALILHMSISQSKINYIYLLKSEQQPDCIYCDRPLTLYHIFWSVPTHFPAKLIFIKEQSIQDHFTMVDIIDILQYLQERYRYNKI